MWARRREFCGLVLEGGGDFSRARDASERFSWRVAGVYRDGIVLTRCDVFLSLCVGCSGVYAVL